MIRPEQKLSTDGFLGRVWAVNVALALGGYGAVSFLSGGVAGQFTAVTIPFRVVVAVISLLLIARIFIAKRRRNSMLLLAVGVFLGLYAFRMFLDFDRLGIAQFQKQIAFLVGVCLIPGLAMHIANDRRYHRLLFSALFVLYAYTSALGIRNITEDSMETGRLLANQYLNPIDLGHAGLSLMLIATYRILQSSNSLLHIGSLLVNGAGATLGASVLALSGSRGPVVAGITCVTTMVVCSLFWKKTRGNSAARRSIVLVAVLMAGVAGVSFAGRNGGTVMTRITSLSDTRTGDSESRLPMYQEAFDGMLDSPITGATTLISNGMYPHNSILEAGMALGVGGAIAMIWLLVLICARSVKLVLTGEEAGLIGLLAIQQVVASQFSGAIWSDDNLWTTGLFALGTQPAARRLVMQVIRTRVPVDRVSPVGAPRASLGTEGLTQHS